MIEQRVIVGDCVDVMARLDAESIDAIVTDPPYGLEFMGKEWDRLGDEGARVTAHRAPTKASGDFNARMGSIPTFNASQNVRCRVCGHWRYSGTPCVCAAPEFPNIKGSQARRMAEWHEAWAAAALRVLKPGAHLLAFGGTRTFHRLAVGIEDAGFEIRDVIAWMFGQGFPKSLDVSKAIDREAGAERELTRPGTVKRDGYGDDWDTGSSDTRPRYDEPATDLARQWAGWGTALKPAWEPCIVARKPLRGTVAANVAQYGTGGLNIDACRIEGAYPWRASDSTVQDGSSFKGGSFGDGPHSSGRWPANVALDEEAAAMLDAQSGESRSSGGGGYRPAGADTREGLYGKYGERHLPPNVGIGDTGGASRFFYTAKASRAEREAWGRMKIEPRQRTDSDSRDPDAPGSNNPRLRTSERINDHPTVKPIALMEWLIKLVLPEGGTVLDPFLGSGSTLVAARRLNVNAIGIEQDERSAEIARQRIAAQWEVMLIP